MRGIINAFVYYWVFFRNKHIILPVVFRFQLILFSHTSPLKKKKRKLNNSSGNNNNYLCPHYYSFFSEGMTYLFSVKTKFLIRPNLYALLLI